VPTTDHRHRDQRNDRRAPGLQEQDHHEHDEHDRLGERMYDGIDRFAHGRSSRRSPSVTNAGRKALGHLVHLRDHRIARRQRVRAGRLEHCEDRGRVVVELAAYRVVAGTEVNACDIGKAYDLAVRTRLEHDVAELLSRSQLALALIAITKSASPLIGSAPS